MSAARNERLRALPSVDRLATAVARAEVNARRTELLSGDGGDGDVDLLARAISRLTPGTGRVLNATGIVLHTNLGRAPLAPEARAAVAAAATGYAALELDLLTGKRSRRGRRAEALLVALTAAEDALIVNNGAAAVLLAAAALAGPGRQVIVSRGELVEIGGGLRIADVVAQSGAELVEVGSTNRTRVEDYAEAMSPQTGAILRVHQSNFRMEGYVARPALRELVALGVPVIDDLGSGALDAVRPVLRDEPDVRQSVAGGAALTCFSGDKLLGGPQAGILVGPAQPVAEARAHPLARAMRIDKLCLAALEATLELHLDPDRASGIPVLEMLELTADTLMARTQQLAHLTGGTLTEMSAAVGGGSLPLRELPGPAVALQPGSDGAEALAARLRQGEPSLIARVHNDRVLLSARTLSAEEIPIAAGCVARAGSARGGEEPADPS
ncbi:MAG: L-seryl-tRNA(Sec) selenium transferase [Solirubrobacteraceae bacterium]